MKLMRRAGVLVLLGIACGGFAAIGLVRGQQIHKNGFETMKMGWMKGGCDAPYQEKAHVISDQVAHGGRHSEFLQFEAERGQFIHYAYPTGKALIAEELAATIWLKSNRAGMQLLARVVLPRERDPQNLDQLLTTYIRGDVYLQIGQWQRLQLARPVQLAKVQQGLMQEKLKRSFDFTDAYIDGLVLNVYGGPGPTDVWIDDVEVGPISAANPFRPAIGVPGAVKGQPVTTTLPRGDGKGLPGFDGNKLRIDNRPFLFRGIVVTDTPLDKLRAARFNTVFLSDTANPALVREAGDHGLWVVPTLRLFGPDARPRSNDELARALSRFNDAQMLFVNLGNTLTLNQATTVANATDTVKALDPGRVFAGDVWEGMRPYSNVLNLVGAHRWPLMTTLELPQYREWLRQRRELANPSAFMWTTIQTHLPDELAQVLYDRPAAGSFDEPVGPQAEHVQLLTYTALASGCRGLAFSSDRFLADSHQGRDRLLACALVNLELEMLEPFLAGSEEAEWAETSEIDVKAAVIRSPLGILVLPIWEGAFTQFVPGQASARKLKVTVPPVPPGMQAWEVSAADVRHLKPERVAGGTRITLPEFGLTAAIVFTSSTDVIARFQEQAKGRRQLAAQWAHDMAAYELDKVMKVEDQLVKQGHTVPDGKKLLADAQRRLRESRQMWERRAFPEAYAEAQRSLRPLRILMRAQWEKAVRGSDSPVVTPYTASYFTLPRYWAMMDDVKRSAPAANVLAGGDFEAPAQRKEDEWHPEERSDSSDLELIAQRVSDVNEPTIQKKDVAPPAAAKKKTPAAKQPTPAKAGKAAVVEVHRATPQQGKQCAMLRIQPAPGKLAPLALERTLLTLHSPEVRLPPGALVQVSAWVCVPAPISGSPDGALFYDSAGGDALAIRLTDPIPWKKFTVYRRVPASGKIQVTLALTGVGTVYFDDVRIEPLRPTGAAVAGN